MAVISNSKTLQLGEDGILQFTGQGDYTFSYKKFVQVRFDGGYVTNIDADSYSSITALSIGVGSNVSMLLSEVAQLEIADLSGTLDILGDFSFSQAGAAGSYESGVNLDDLLGTAIQANGAGAVAANLTLNGSKADAFQQIWDYLDDAYVAGQNYYNLDLNENFVRLGIEYANYLENGGAPLTDVTAKFSADGSDADLIPERAQSMHDNLLGNLWKSSLERRRFDDALEAELLDLIPDGYETRPVFSGEDRHIGSAEHDGARAFDYEKGWDRADYIESTMSGTVDARAQDAAEGDMLFGDSNTADGYAIVSHLGAGVELAVKAKERGGKDYDGALGDDGLVHYAVDGGLQPGTNNRAAWNIDFAMTSGIGANDETSDEFVFRLLVDVDKSEATDFREIDLTRGGTGINDNPLSDYSEQNSTNFGFGFLYTQIDNDPDVEGIQAYDFGEARFDVRLEAYDDGQLIAENQVAINVIAPVDSFFVV